MNCHGLNILTTFVPNPDICLKNWSYLYSFFIVPFLANRRSYHKLLLIYKLIHGFYYCLAGFLFSYRANVNLRLWFSDNKQLHRKPITHSTHFVILPPDSGIPFHLTLIIYLLLVYLRKVLIIVFVNINWNIVYSNSLLLFFYSTLNCLILILFSACLFALFLFVLFAIESFIIIIIISDP